MIQKIVVYDRLEDYYALTGMSSCRFVKVNVKEAEYEGIQTMPGGWIFLYAPQLHYDAAMTRGAN